MFKQMISEQRTVYRAIGYCEFLIVEGFTDNRCLRNMAVLSVHLS